MRVEQEEMRFHAVMELLLEKVRGRVIDIQINEFHSSGVFFLNTLHHGCHRQAGAAPESKEFNQLRFSGRQLHRTRIGGM
jgi:hypothetical protein